MQKETRAIGFACFLGALIGAFITLEVSERFTLGVYLWVVGIPIGGLVGYIAYDFRSFAQGISQAWHDVIAWRPDGQFWRSLITSFSYIFVGIAFTFSFFLSLFTAMIIYYGVDGDWTGGNEAFMFMLIMPPILTVPLSLLFMGPPEWNHAKRVAEARSLFLNCNLINVSWLVLYYSAYGMMWLLVSGVPMVVSIVRRSIRTFARFLWQVFCNVHSNERLLCLVDASFGVVIGYFFGSAIIGGIAGSFLGILNYEILSVRILKLVPARSRS